VELAEDAPGLARASSSCISSHEKTPLRDVRAAIDYLRITGSERIGMVGLSVGGHLAYLAASEFDLAAAVIVYGSWIPTTEIPLGQPQPTLARTPGITGRLLVLVGEHDRGDLSRAAPPDRRCARGSRRPPRRGRVRRSRARGSSTIDATRSTPRRQRTLGPESGRYSPLSWRASVEPPSAAQPLTAHIGGVWVQTQSVLATINWAPRLDRMSTVTACEPSGEAARQER
jgi:pimeloyl-ACP methyl ester carboxylesterase